ncbi:bifunctional metallophosphatase/5'-nucleotidase [Streptomyces sp. NPDC002387]|uniref:bifunctional metallophosphatase/5'-nucleotidase n=1 Tax=unclassified Streptomyces TaxID=2593676 RepID=UPI0036745A0B
MSHGDDIGRRNFLRAGTGAIASALVGAPGWAGVGQHAYASANAIEPNPDRHVEVQLLNITDLHGYLQPAEVGGYNVLTDHAGDQIVVGGVGYLATHLKRLRAGRKNSIFFASGDNFSGWTFEADSLANEPTVEVLNKLGLQFSTVGNHELDQRFPEYLIDHIEKGKPYGVPGLDGSFTDSTGKRFGGANFPFYTSNIVYADSGLSIVPPYSIVWVEAGKGRRLPVGFIHLTVLGTVTGSTSYQPHLGELDQIATVNTYAAELKARGVNAIVVSMHDGGAAGTDFNGLSDPTGFCFQLAAQASPDIAAIVTGHWHAAFNGMLPDPLGRPRPVVEAGCHGQLISEIVLRLDPRTGEVVRELTTSVNHPTTHDVPPDPEIQAIADYWVDQATRRYAQPVARQSAGFSRTANALGESTMGDLAADAVYWLANQDGSHADLALFSTAPATGSAALGGDGLTYAQGDVPGDEDGVVLFGEAWNAFGYGAVVLSVTVTGAAVHAALEGQWTAGQGGTVAFAPLAVSHNVRYSVDPGKPPGSRIDPQAVFIDDTVLDIGRSYRLAGLSYTLIGADGTSAFTSFTDPVRGERDREGFIRYLRQRQVIAPLPLNRVTAVGQSG